MEIQEDNDEVQCADTELPNNQETHNDDISVSTNHEENLYDDIDNQDEELKESSFANVISGTEISASKPIVKKTKGEIRKPYSAWTYFSTEKREKMTEKQTAFIARQISEEYKQLTQTEKLKYIELAKQDKARYLREIEEIELKFGADENKERRLPRSELIIPMGRVKKICKLDPDVRAVGKDAVAAITKATDEFVALLVNHAIKSAFIRGTGKTIRDVDIINAVHNNVNLNFLKLDFPRKPVDASTDATKQKRVSAANTSSLKNSSDSSTANPPKEKLLDGI